MKKRNIRILCELVTVFPQLFSWGIDIPIHSYEGGGVELFQPIPGFGN